MTGSSSPARQTLRTAGRSRCLAAMTATCTAAGTMAGCATAPLEMTGSLSSYSAMTKEDGLLGKTMARADGAALKRAKTVRIVPVTIARVGGASDLERKDRDLLATAVNRALCNAISQQYSIAAADQPADLTVTGTITYVGATSQVASAASQAASIAGSVLIPVPGVPVPRIPIGMGGLAVEAEARDARGQQVAALVWARGANIVTSKARISPFGDAYDLASDFGRDFRTLLKYGPERTLAEKVVSAVPTMADMRFTLDGEPDSPACIVFGRGPGIVGMVGGSFGAPPAWTDDGIETGAIDTVLGRTDRGARTYPSIIKDDPAARDPTITSTNR